MTKLQKKLLSRTKQAGVSMIELSIVLVIVAVLSAAVFFGFQANSRRVEVADNISAVTETAASLKKSFGRQNLYTSLTPVATGTALAVQSRSIPENLRTTNTTANNSYGAAITVLVGNLGVAGDSATLTWPQVPANQCMDLVIGTKDVARRITVGAVVVKPTDGVVNLATLATQCDIGVSQPVIYDVGR